ncbi:phosphatidylinositol 345-trisphosphate 3-phosphatase and dual-specificity protein phosphatase PTEN-like, partial [Trifolium medium]|nr:phosphatidylinositol 345-trisphosphate 3-phosphatase and dual-specificity protein phosphatase PTEN-like [Trifolium medium]
MGFPGGDLSSGIVGYIEGFYRNHMDEVIKFFETHHK